MSLVNFDTRPGRRTSSAPLAIDCEICVVGSGAAGISAALEAARLGKSVVLVEGQAAIGGQAAASLIGVFCGFYSNGNVKSPSHQLTYGLADEMLRSLLASGGAYRFAFDNTVLVRYDEVGYARWAEEAVRESSVRPLLGAVLRGAVFEERRLRTLEVATRYGDILVRAEGFVDASGDAVLAWYAGLPVQEPVQQVFGTQMFILEGADENAVRTIDPVEIKARLKAEGERYGLVRHDGQLFTFPGRGAVTVNMTHIPTSLDPIEMSRAVLEGRAQADRLLAFLKDQFPNAMSGARVRAYGLPGIRQTRWIEGVKHLTADEVRRGERFPDAIARSSWPIELHNTEAQIHWEKFDDRHIHYIPLGCMMSAAADNYIAAGRCVDGDVGALASIRVIGPCMAMGAAAAHALDLAGSGPIHQIDISALQERLHDNLIRCDVPTMAGETNPSAIDAG